MSIETTDRFVVVTDIVVWELGHLVSEGVPLVVVESQGVFFKTKPLLKVQHILSDHGWRQRILTVDPSGKVVSPPRNIIPLEHFTLASPLSIGDDPLSVDLRGIIPVALERNDSDWEV